MTLPLYPLIRSFFHSVTILVIGASCLWHSLIAEAAGSSKIQQDKALQEINATVQRIQQNLSVLDQYGPKCGTKSYLKSNCSLEPKGVQESFVTPLRDELTGGLSSLNKAYNEQLAPSLAIPVPQVGTACTRNKDGVTYYSTLKQSLSPVQNEVNNFEKIVAARKAWLEQTKGVSDKAINCTVENHGSIQSQNGVPSAVQGDCVLAEFPSNLTLQKNLLYLLSPYPSCIKNSLVGKFLEKQYDRDACNRTNNSYLYITNKNKDSLLNLLLKNIADYKKQLADRSMELEAKIAENSGVSADCQNLAQTKVDDTKVKGSDISGTEKKKDESTVVDAAKKEPALVEKKKEEAPVVEAALKEKEKANEANTAGESGIAAALEAQQEASLHPPQALDYSNGRHLSAEDYKKMDAYKASIGGEAYDYNQRMTYAKQFKSAAPESYQAAASNKTLEYQAAINDAYNKLYGTYGDSTGPSVFQDGVLGSRTKAATMHLMSTEQGKAALEQSLRARGLIH